MSYKKIEIEAPGKKHFQELEAYKKLRLNLQFCGKNIKVISFTSAIQNEGKSEVSYNISISLAEMGKKVVYIDADLRNSVFNRTRKIESEVFGLAHYLIGEKKEEEVIYETQIEGLYVVSAGAYPPNPSELLSQDSYKEFIEYCRENFDYVIVDNAPLGLVVDCAITAPHSDGIVMVIEQGRIPRALAKSVVEQCHKSGCKILGVVMNKVVEGNARGYVYGYGNYYNTNNTMSVFDYDPEMDEKTGFFKKLLSSVGKKNK